jgi:hypothetical protein
MTTRTTQIVAQFVSPFVLPGFDVSLPAGDYRIDQDEELIEVGSRLAWRRIGAFVHLPALGADSPTHQMVPVNAADLDAAIAKDRAQL